MMPAPGTLLYVEDDGFEGSRFCLFLGKNSDLQGISLVFWLDHRVGQCQVFSEDIPKRFIPVEIDKVEDGDTEESLSVMSEGSITTDTLNPRPPKNRVWIMIGKDRITLKKKE